MKARLLSAVLLLVALCSAGIGRAQPGCSPPTTNGTCATAAVLAVNGACINGTTCGGGAQSASTCLYAGSQCSWYSFTATAASMYVNIDVTATDGCHISSNVYRATGPCTGLVQVSCLSGAPLDDMHPLTGLTIGSLYYIQVCYSPGGPCGNNGSAEYCIEVGIPDPPCNTCSIPCGAALGYPTAPTVAQVVADCTTDPFGPPLQPGSTYTFCNIFTATAASVSFNVIITSNCGGGNVTALTWALYNSPSCGAAMQTGTLASLVLNGLVVGNGYVFCYTFTVPGTCTHSQHCPYFVGATTPLPVTWLDVSARPTEEHWVEVRWSTGTERNNDHFTVERSQDALHFEDIGRVEGAGNTVTEQHYRYFDTAPYPGISYYRVRQTDHNGTYEGSRTVSVELNGPLSDLVILPNPVQGDGMVSFTAPTESEVVLEVHDAQGRLVWSRTRLVDKGPQMLSMATASLTQGVYSLSLCFDHDRRIVRFIKE